MKRLCVILLLATFTTAALAGSCGTGKCISPTKWQAMQRKAMKQRLATPRRSTPAIDRLNQQIVQLARTNVNGRNNVAIRGLQSQRNQLSKAQLQCR